MVHIKVSRPGHQMCIRRMTDVNMSNIYVTAASLKIQKQYEHNRGLLYLDILPLIFHMSHLFYSKLDQLKFKEK
jgi:hypothetical protein